MPEDSELAQLETFGPVAAIEVVDSAEEAVARANATAYGLSAGIITSDADRGFALAQQIDAGIVHVNDQPVGDEPQMPFGGVKDSGWGRFGGQAVIDEFTELRWITDHAAGRIRSRFDRRPLREAVAELVRDGDIVALEGFTHLIPHAAGHELIRQGRRDLTLVRMTPDVIYDQLIGMGCARKLVFSWGGNPGVGSLHRFRDAVEHGWPRRSSSRSIRTRGWRPRTRRARRTCRSACCAATRAATSPRTRASRRSTCPFTGEELAAVPALRPDVGIIHAQQADRHGNVQLWGIIGVQKEVVLASARSIVTVEEIVDELEPRPGGVVLPRWVVDAVALAPGGAHPSYAHGYYERDNDFYVAWDAISRDRDRFRAWMQRHVLETADVDEYRAQSCGHAQVVGVTDGTATPRTR